MRSSGSLRRSVAKAYSMRIFSLGLGDFLEIPDGDGNGGNGSPGNGGEPPALPNKFLMRRRRPNRNLFQPLRVA